MMMFEEVFPSRSKSAARWLRYLDAEVFPDDSPFQFPMAHWFLGFNFSPNEPVAYCGWKAVPRASGLVGFHYRAGVLKKFRGKGIQQKMIKLRERQMREQSIEQAVTYTSADNAASMRSLISAGYRPYAPTSETHLAEGRAGFVHWLKDLK